MGLDETISLQFIYIKPKGERIFLHFTHQYLREIHNAKKL